ncbi:reverse transcriptase [Phytophthora megakarya]|uniref:Reverse transcriptase n=1 Tax=Phytophthora megakarya TaxID=4795 RepID=A0A225VJC8_9STRA|nr:reverse transcriptase [Phytophthora megakarya]
MPASAGCKDGSVRSYASDATARGATESDGPVSAADTPDGASEPPVVARGERGLKGVSGQGPDTTKKFSAVRRRCDNSVSTMGVDTHSISESRKFSAVRRRGDNGVSTPGVATHRSALSCTKQGAIKPGLMTRARRYKNPPAVASRLECLPVVSRNIRPWPGLDETQKKRRRRHKTLRKSRSGTETLHGVSAGPTQVATMAVETLNVLTRASTGYQYKKMDFVDPPTNTSELTSLPVMTWKRFANDLYDGRIEQLCILSDRERMKSEAEELRQLFGGSTTESEDTLSAKTKKEPFEDQRWDSLKSSLYYAILREHRDVLPDEISAALPQDNGIDATSRRATSTMRAVNEKTDVKMHKEHLRELLGLMRKHKLYANLKKCIFGASEIPVLGCLVGNNGVRPDPEKVRVINEWPTPSNFLGLATYLCKYVDNYAGKIRPLSQLLKMEAAWVWTPERQQTFDAVKLGLTEAPILAVVDQDRPFHVFRVYLLCNTPFVVYTDHASLRPAVKPQHISPRMARWLSFFAEYNFRVEYKPGRLNVVADALSRRPDYAVKTVDVNRRSDIYTVAVFVKAAYAHDADAKQLIEFLSAPSDKARRKLAPRLRASAHQYRVHDGLLLYSAVDENAERIVVPNDPDLRSRIMYEYHDVPTTGHPVREKTYSLLT